MVRTIIPRGQTHSLQVTLCLVSEEWPRVGSSPGSTIRDNYSSRVDSFSPGYTLFSVGRMAQGGE
jgi:hypothetical protein